MAVFGPESTILTPERPNSIFVVDPQDEVYFFRAHRIVAAVDRERLQDHRQLSPTNPGSFVLSCAYRLENDRGEIIEGPSNMLLDQCLITEVELTPTPATRVVPQASVPARVMESVGAY